MLVYQRVLFLKNCIFWWLIGIEPRKMGILMEHTLWEFGYIAIENGPFIVGLPIQDDFPVRYVSLPEGISLGTFTWQANWVVENTIIPSHSTAWLNAFPTNGYNNSQ